MKTVGLDLGDQWTGVAISDALGMFARPYQTVPTAHLEKELAELFAKEKIGTVVVGVPTTMKGGMSQQTNKVVEHIKKLKTLFPNLTWVSWDERMSSKRAHELRPAKTKEEKLQSHALAAAFILQSYLDYAQNLRQNQLLPS